LVVRKYIFILKTEYLLNQTIELEYNAYANNTVHYYYLLYNSTITQLIGITT